MVGAPFTVLTVTSPLPFNTRLALCHWATPSPLVARSTVASNLLLGVEHLVGLFLFLPLHPHPLPHHGTLRHSQGQVHFLPALELLNSAANSETPSLVACSGRSVQYLILPLFQSSTSWKQDQGK